MPSLLDLRRTTAALVAVAMSAALIAFAFIISDSFRTQTQTSARVSVGDATVVVQDGRGANSTENALDDALLNRVSALDGVDSVRGAHWDMLWLDLPKQLRGAAGVQVAAQDVPALTKFTTLSSGRLPAATGEVAIDSMLAEQQGLSVGDTIRFRTKDGDDAKAVRSAPTVVGIVSAGADSKETGTGVLYATAEQLQAMGTRMDYRSLYENAKPGTDPGALLAKVSQTVHSVQPAASVQSRDEANAQRAQAQTGGTMIATIINLLAPVCAAVAIIVIATTFSTLVARQTRMVGLMRCIGTTRRQVMLAVLRTGLMTGLVGSVLGAALGTGLGAIMVSSGIFADLKADQLTISPVSLGLTIALGTLVTLIAVLRPARSATRISPDRSQAPSRPDAEGCGSPSPESSLPSSVQPWSPSAFRHPISSSQHVEALWSHSARSLASRCSSPPSSASSAESVATLDSRYCAWLPGTWLATPGGPPQLPPRSSSASWWGQRSSSACPL